MEPVPLLDLKAQHASLRDAVEVAVQAVVSSQVFVLGPEVERFEAAAASYLGAAHAVGCASGTDALILSLAALGIGPGDEVVTTPFSFFATASCAVRVGAKPVFVDVERGTLNIDPGGIEDAVTSRTRALLPVHLFGQCAAMDPILDVAERRGLAVVEDACQAMGARHLSSRPRRAGHAGTLGDAGCYSFFPSKNLGGFGDGGMIATDDDALAARLRLLRVHGAKDRYHHLEVGWNSRLDALQAAVLSVKLPHLDAWCEARRVNAERYDRLFTESGVVGSVVSLPVRSASSTHIFHQYTIEADSRDGLVEHLRTEGIGHGIYYPVPLHLQRCFADLGHRQGDFPVTEAACARVVSLPMYPELTPSQQERVVAAIAAYYR
jgi:dTDP-4-amino-4,6-dideoxygalactose transaminase